MVEQNETSGDLLGASGRNHLPTRKRSGRQRLDNILPTIARQKEFEIRVDQAGRDTVALADLMAEAIAMQKEANALEPVGRDGRVVATMEDLAASLCMFKARSAYLTARGSNHD